MTLTSCQDHILTENIWFVCSKTSYSGDERRCYRCGTTMTNSEDTATQPIEAGGWVSHKHHQEIHQKNHQKNPKKSKTNHREIQKKITKMQTCKLIFVRVWTRSEKNGCYKPRVSFFNILSYQRSHSKQKHMNDLIKHFPSKNTDLIKHFPFKTLVLL